MVKSNSGDLTQSFAKQFKQSPIKAEDSFDGFGDPYYIQGRDPERIYKDISFDNFKRNGFRDIRGWIPLTKQNRTTEVMPSCEEYGIQGDGLFHRGDAIVAWMPKDRHKQMRARVLGQVKDQEDRALRGGEAADLGKKLKVNGKSNLTIEEEGD